MVSTRLLFFVGFIFNSFYFFSQTVQIQGDVSDDRGGLPSAQIIITRGSTVENKLLTDGMGRYNFVLPLGGDFMVTVEKDGYVTKKFSINTGNVPPEKAAIKFPVIQASLSLFRKMEGVDYSALKEPLNKYKYNPLLDNFEYDAGYLEQMINKLTAIKEAEKEVIKKEKAQENLYQTTIKDGDKAFTSKDYETAIASYQEAQKMKPKEVYPGTQIINAKKLLDLDLAKKAAEDAALKSKADLEAKKAADAAAAKAKADADATAKIKADGDAARAKAEAEALAKKQLADAAAKKQADELANKSAKEREEADAKAKIAAEIQAKKDAESAAAKAKADKEAADRANAEKSKAELDAQAKKAADEIAAKKAAEYAAAKAISDKEAAEKAATAKAEADARAKNQAEADAIEKKKTDEENKKLQASDNKYKTLLANADEAFSKNDYAGAKTMFTEASTLRPNDSYPKNRLLEVGFGLRFNETVKVADELFTAKRYKEAKKKYEESLTYKGGDTYAKNRLMECEKLINGDGNQVTDERVKQLLAKYGPGVTEETITGPNVVIIQRVVVRDNMAWVFQKKIFNWGGSSCFRDNVSITENVFDTETKP